MNLGDDYRKLLTLHAPRPMFMSAGAIVAAAIPMAYGASVLWPYIDFIKWGCGPGNISGKCMEYFPSNTEPHLFEYPVGLTCLIFTPIVCWICCRYVVRMIDGAGLTLGALARFTLLSAFKWQFIAGVLHLFYIYLSGGLRQIDTDIVVGMIITVLLAIVVHGLIAVFMTLPLSLASLAAFRIIALKRVR